LARDSERRELSNQTGTHGAPNESPWLAGAILSGHGLSGGIGALLLGGLTWPSFRSVVDVLLVLLAVSMLFGRRTIGTIEYIPIYNPEFEQRIRMRYQSEIRQLTGLGFDQIFFYGESFLLIRLFLLFPALIVLMMLSKREVMTVQNGTKFLSGYPVFTSGDKTAYSQPSGLGIKFHTAFQDGVILMTKNYGDTRGYGPTVRVHSIREASIGETWAEHQRRVQMAEMDGKRVDRQISFQAFAEISHKETAV
jgi:hypothetical protein